ncbi:hypothetical protein ACOSP7_029100 [Xanthoceras sorbifolium]
MCTVMGAPIAQAAITCGQVITSSLGPCIPYLRAGGAVLPACCSGVKTLAGPSTTAPYHQQLWRQLPFQDQHYPLTATDLLSTILIKISISSFNVHKVKDIE